MTTLRIPGHLESDPLRPALITNSYIGTHTERVVRFDTNRSASSESVDVQEVEENAVLEFEFENDVKLWMSVAQYQEDFVHAQTRGGGGGEIVIAPEFAIGPVNRGFFGWVLKSLRIIDVDPSDKLADLATDKLAKTLEDKLDPSPGLFRIESEDGKLKIGAMNNALDASDQPHLLLLHGTASSTAGSFSALWQHKEWRDLLPVYKDRALALQHRTLTVSPVANAIEVLQQLPVEARLHIVSHSRGGLVGELLCYGAGLVGTGAPFSQANLNTIYGDRSDDLEELEQLNKLLREKRPRVERFVRVACPARGTTLAGKRLDRYLSIVLNLITSIPGFDNPAIEFVKALTLGVVRNRADPEQLPGLEAMMPSAPLIKLLNNNGQELEGELAIISGDIEGGSVWEKLKVLATDLYYRADHDLIVNSSAMLGGAKRRDQGTRAYREQGPEVNHFNYFRNPSSASQVVSALEGDMSSFKSVAAIAAVTRGKPRGPNAEPKPVVFLLPGITGSHLSLKGNRIWLDPFSMAFGGLKRIPAETDVEAEALVGSAYSDLVDFLGDSHEVIPFPYDWRRSLTGEAERLSIAIRTTMAATQQPIRILGHSMGGLLARLVFANHPDTWHQLRARNGFRFVMLGTPNNGSHSIIRLLMGQERTAKLLALLDVTNSQKEILEVISAYPGVLELLPSDIEHGFFSDTIWQKLHDIDPADWHAPQQKNLSIARNTWQQLQTSPVDPEHMLYVAGQAEETPESLEIEGDKISFFGTRRGDGRVPWDTGIPKALKTWYMHGVAHGDLAAHKPAFAALQELLAEGTTNRLPTSEPALRGAIERFALPADIQADIYPAERDLIDAALGAGPSRQKLESIQPSLNVEVAHGDLAYSRSPVLVGHYKGDTIISAEAALDWHLGGRLRSRYQLGYYPGLIASAEVILQSDPLAKPQGAVVVGLGSVGELTAGQLTTAVTTGALRYAIQVFESYGGTARNRLSAPLTSLLVGTGAGGLSVDDALFAILRGVIRANRVLSRSGYEDKVVIDKVQFIELFQDRAIAAIRALRNIDRDGELRSLVKADLHLQNRRGAQSRLTYDEPADWWQRLQITCSEGGTLNYTSLTQRARAEVRLQATQRNLLDQFVNAAVGSAAGDQALAKTLFELMVPNDLKGHSQDRRPLVLVVDKSAARYPWELMQDRFDQDNKPMAVQSGLLRQLSTGRFRPNPQLAFDDDAFVVGDPVSSFPVLEGAQREARTVIALLEGNSFNVTSQIRGSARAITQSLFASSYRVLHLAGHGVYEYEIKGEPVTGMVLGDNTFLTTAEINQMRDVPELVFINCCHLGKIEAPDESAKQNRHQLAANLATQLIEMGVRAVVAAGWAVDDAAAETFAQVFYERMLYGEAFGTAVLSARQETYSNHPGVNTWGAYQCYGDPDYRLRSRKSESRKGATSYASPGELISVLDNLTNSGETAGEEDCREYINDLLGNHKHWLEMAGVCEAAARAFKQYDYFDDSVVWYQKAIATGEAVSTGSMEQCINLQMLGIARGWMKIRTDSMESSLREKERKALLEKALDVVKQLDLLCELFGNSVERLSLLGSAYKRIAMVRPNIANLKKMADYYRKAHELSLSLKNQVNPYPLLNWLAALVLQRERTRASGAPDYKEHEHWINLAKEAAEQRDYDEPSFWDASAIAECEFTRGLLLEDLSRRQEAVVEAYKRARQRGASSREFRSVLEHMEFVQELLPESNALQTPLAWIIGELSRR